MAKEGVVDHRWGQRVRTFADFVQVNFVKKLSADLGLVKYGLLKAVSCAMSLVMEWHYEGASCPSEKKEYLSSICAFDVGQNAGPIQLVDFQVGTLGELFVGSLSDKMQRYRVAHATKSSARSGAFYAVYRGALDGEEIKNFITQSWVVCAQLTQGVSGAVYAGFKSHKKAREFLDAKVREPQAAAQPSEVLPGLKPAGAPIAVPLARAVPQAESALNEQTRRSLDFGATKRPKKIIRSRPRGRQRVAPS